MGFLMAAPLAVGIEATGFTVAAGTEAAMTASSLGSLASFAMPAFAGLQMAGGYMQGQEEKAQANAAADVLEYNAAVERESAKAERYAAESEVEKLNRQQKLAIGMQRAAVGKSGFTMAGTPLAIMADTISQYELDRQTALWNAEVKAGKYESQASIYESSAKQQKQKASRAIGKALLGSAISAGSVYASSGLNSRSTGSGRGMDYERA
jgi:hypothetical protein